MQEIQTRKRKLESDLKEILDKFHRENEIYTVKYISVQSNVTEVMGRKNEILNSPVKVSVNIEVV